MEISDSEWDALPASLQTLLECDEEDALGDPDTLPPEDCCCIPACCCHLSDCLPGTSDSYPSTLMAVIQATGPCGSCPEPNLPLEVTLTRYDPGFGTCDPPRFTTQVAWLYAPGAPIFCNVREIEIHCSIDNNFPNLPWVFRISDGGLNTHDIRLETVDCNPIHLRRTGVVDGQSEHILSPAVAALLCGGDGSLESLFHIVVTE